MSAIYLTEPPTQGKVLIKTTFGDIDVELWSKEAPLACRNFIQLALEGYYDNTLVNRVVKGFMIQMGDPTGTGTGGKSIWGRPFKDEAHGRLKFNHRGQVAMANENTPNSNQSQFFVTLDACEWLDRKHTIFGKVTGNTIFNVLRVGEVEVGGEGGDRPIDELKIKGIEVLWNPFDDIVPRDLSKNKEGTGAGNAQPDKSKKIKAVKDTKLLSFGDDEEEVDDEGAQFKVKMQSSHDTNKSGKSKKSSSSSGGSSGAKGVAVATTSAASITDRYGDQSAGPGASQRPTGQHSGGGNGAGAGNSGEESAGEEGEGRGGGGGVNAAADFDKMMRMEIIKKRQSDVEKESKRASFQSDHAAAGDAPMDAQALHSLVTEDKRAGQLQSSSSTFKKLKEDLLRSRRAVNVMMGDDASKLQEESAFKELVTPLEQRRRKYIKRKSEFGDRSEETMEKLRAFTSTIRSTKQQQQHHSSAADEEAEQGSAVTYSGQVLEEDEAALDPEREKLELQNWFVGKLKCKKHIDDKYRNGAGGTAPEISADGRNVDDYMVIDPRKQRK